jgi:Kef-type K+ transport system membrane component KefB
MDLFYMLLVLLVVTRAFGEVAEHLAQPALVGELIAGIALGAAAASLPDALPNLVGLSDSQVFVTITDLGMFFLMLFAGVEMQPHKVFERSAKSLGVAVGGMLVPLGLGMALGWAFLPPSELRLAQCLFIGTALAITAVPATVRILTDLGQLDSPVGQTIVSAAVFDDILSLLLLAWLTGMVGAGEPPGLAEFALLSGKIILFFIITTIIGLFIFPWGGRLMHHLKAHELEISAVLVGAFAFAVLAEVLGLHFIVGAFVAGLYFGQKTIDMKSYERVRDAISAMTFGFLAPIFFASIGFNIEFTAVIEAPWFLGLLILCAFAGKVVGAGAAARGLGFSRNDSAAIGIGMSPRGAVELVIAGIALEAGLFATVTAEITVVEYLFSAVVMMSIVTTVVSPIILARVFAFGKD